MKLHVCALSFVSLLIGACVPELGTSDETLTDDAAWRLVPTPNVGSGVNQLYGVSAAAGNDAWAVGYYAVPPGVFPAAPLAEHWNGATWSIAATPQITNATKPVFNAVFDVGPHDAWAVGQYIPTGGPSVNGAVLAEHWTGQRWALARLPLPPGAGSGLNAISGTSANDIWAVGFQALGVGTQYTLTMHYDGSSWTIVPSYPTNLSNLFAVKAIAPDDVWAIGVQYTSPIAIHWDGTSWTSFPLPIQTNPPIINTVPVSLDATASDDVWAVGWENVPTGTEGQTTFAEAYHWDGTRWVTVPIAGLETSGSAIHGIASIGPDNVWVLGNAGADQLTVHFDGTAWTAVPNPGGGFYAGWHPLAASPAGDVWAVGETDYTSSTFALHYR